MKILKTNYPPKGKFKRRQIDSHKDFLKDKQFALRREKLIKVKKREQEEKEAAKEIKNYERI